MQHSTTQPIETCSKVANCSWSAGSNVSIWASKQCQECGHDLHEWWQLSNVVRPVHYHHGEFKPQRVFVNGEEAWKKFLQAVRCNNNPLHSIWERCPFVMFCFWGWLPSPSHLMPWTRSGAQNMYRQCVARKFTKVGHLCYGTWGRSIQRYWRWSRGRHGFDKDAYINRHTHTLTRTHAHIITHVCTGIMVAYSDKDTHDEFISSNNLVDVAFLCTVWACSDFPRGLLQARAAMDELFKMIVMIKKSLEKQCANIILSTNVCSRAYTK